MKKIIKESETGKFFFSLNSDNLIDVESLFYLELGEGGQGFDDLQLHCWSDTTIDDFDTDDARRNLFAQVPSGGALLYDCNSNESIIFTEQEMNDGVDSVIIGVYAFSVVDDE